jgi:hypothetical protein
MRSATPVTTPGARCNVSGRRSLEAWASNYCIPWNKGNPAFRSAMELKNRPQKTDLLHFIRKVGEDISEQIGDSPGAANLTVIASAMVQHNPASLADYVGGMGILGDGSSSLRCRLIRYFENESRKNKNPLQRKLLTEYEDNLSEGDAQNDDADLTSKRKKKKVKSTFSKDSYGCSNWQPAELPDGETEDSQEVKRLWLKAEYLKSDHDMVLVCNYMEITYGSQRFFYY